MDRYHALLDAELSAFVDACTTPDRSARVPASTMYAAYVAWSERQPSPIPPMTETMFGRIAPAKLIRRREATGQMYLGAALKG